MPPVDLVRLRQAQQAVAAARTARAALVADLANQTAAIAKLEADLRQQAAIGNVSGNAETRIAYERALAARAQAAAQAPGLDDSLRQAIAGLRPLFDPSDADPAYPLLLLPVRIETRFSPDRATLRVRIFPDDVHLDQLDRGLLPEEREAGTAYWTSAWHADATDADTAWRLLIDRVGSQRALWTALALEPTNLATRTADATPIFGEVAPRTRRAAVARLLPDCFTVVAIQGGARSTKVGQPIAPEVTIGLYAGDGSALKTVNGVRLAAGAEWLASYDEAERIGLGITLPLQTPGARIDQLFVYGVRSSLDPAQTAAELKSLFQAHQCTKGLAVVPQGTPSNNTENNRAGWQRRLPPSAPQRDPLSLDPDANASVLARALGLDAATFASASHAREREQPLARAFNGALWEPTWGTFLDKIETVGRDGPTLDEADREQARAFHRDYVRGRGPMPALRVGNQPYGLLPASALEKRWQTDDAFEQRLVKLLQKLRLKWRAYLINVPRIGAGDPDKTVLEILGSSPVSLGLRARTVLSEEFAQTAGTISGTATTDLQLDRTIDELIWEEIHNASLVRRTGSLAAESRPVGLPFADDARDAEVIAQIMAGESPEITSVLQALVTLAWDKATRAVKATSAGGRLTEVIGHAQGLTDAARERVLGLANRAAIMPATSFFAEAQNVRTAAGIDVLPRLAEFQPVESVRSSFGELSLASTSAAARARLGALGAVSWLTAAGRLAELREALTELIQPLAADRVPDERRILVAETLDLASHRLDAWLTGVVSKRLESLRSAQASGICVGAYGWVENLSPAASAPQNGGYIHAPSLTHAATAGILRSAYLSHNSSAGGTGAFAIDLTSARVRAAKHLVDGIRQGQSLSALIGYQIERALHEARLDRLVFSLRGIAPLLQGKLTDRGTAAPQSTAAATSAANILDGVQLVEKYQGKVPHWDAAQIRTLLNAPPANNPYLTGPWPPLTDAEWQSASAAIESAAESCDAVADLLLAESVHQLVQGNTPRASAALDTASSGDSVPPEPDVVATRLATAPVTHRVLLVLDGSDSWNAERPRAKAAPRLESWAAARLGDPATVVVALDAAGAVMTLAQFGMCALDVVYDSANAGPFYDRLRAALPALPADVAFLQERPASLATGQRTIGELFELATALRAVIVTARPASPLDLAIPNSETTRAVDSDELAAALDRAMQAADLLSLRANMLNALLSREAVDPGELAAALESLAAFGIIVPNLGQDSVVQLAEAALSEAMRRDLVVRPKLVQPPTVDNIVAAGEAIFGDGFWIAPAIGAPSAADNWQAAFAAGAIAASPAQIRRFLADCGSVRDGVRRYGKSLLLCGAIGVAPKLRVAQMSGVGRITASSWLGAELDADQPTPDAPVCCTVLDAPTGYDGTGKTEALVLDQWVDVLGVRERRGEGANAPVDERTTTGITFNAQAATSRAPQVLLLAISPDGARWTSDRLLDVLQDTLDLAKLRGVTYERTNGAARVLPAIYENSWSLQGEKALDLRFVAEKIKYLSPYLAYVKEPS